MIFFISLVKSDIELKQKCNIKNFLKQSSIIECFIRNKQNFYTNKKLKD